MVKMRELGESKVGCVVGLIVLLVVVFVAVKVIPVRVAVASLQDYMEETAQRANLMTNQEDNPITKQIAEKIYQQAKADDLPLKMEDIKVSFGNGRIYVSAKYQVTIDFVVYKYVWNVEHNVERLLF